MNPKGDAMVVDRPVAVNALRTDGGFAARGYARSLLASLGVDRVVEGHADHPALAWRRSGLMQVTGAAAGAARVCPAALCTAADGALLALAALAQPCSLPSSGAALLGERARMLGLSRRGTTSPNRSCHLFDCLDGRIALNLARVDDLDLLPALLGEDAVPDHAALVRMIARQSAHALAERGAELGMAIAIDAPPVPSDRWFRASGVRFHETRKRRPKIIDLSALWAGPLAGALLADIGAAVCKVESASRPDGARAGHRRFFDLLNGKKHLVTLDFRDTAKLQDWIDSADIVIEASRPRALARLGIDAARFVARGGIWVGITGHGRAPAHANRVAFGDDAAVAAGLASVMREGWGEASFAGDAIADPMTGIHAALAAWAMWSRGCSGLIDISLVGVMRHALGAGIATGDELHAWQAMAERDEAALYPLRAPLDRNTADRTQARRA